MAGFVGTVVEMGYKFERRVVEEVCEGFSVRADCAERRKARRKRFKRPVFDFAPGRGDGAWG